MVGGPANSEGRAVTQPEQVRRIGAVAEQLTAIAGEAMRRDQPVPLPAAAVREFATWMRSVAVDPRSDQLAHVLAVTAAFPELDPGPPSR
jgi:hypothetical protein